MMATQSKEVNLIRNENQQARENRPRQQRQTGEAHQFQLCQYCNCVIVKDFILEKDSRESKSIEINKK